jgi:alpha-amylase
MSPAPPNRRSFDRFALGRDLAQGNGRDLILQAFHWNLVKTQGTGTMDGRDVSWYRVLRDHVDAIVALGFTIAYLPPPWRDDSSWEFEGRHGGGEGYFWHDFDLDSRYGTKDELRALIDALHARGVRAIVDLVPNHRDGERMQHDVWPRPGPCWAWGGHDSGAGFDAGAYDLALTYPVVYERVREAMEELTDECGVDGWRWDFVWGYGVEEVCCLIRDTKKIEYFSMGEYWQGDAKRTDDPMIARYGTDERARIIGWARDAGSCAMDIRTKAEIQTADPRNLRYGLCASRRREDRRLCVTYVDNHDTGASPWSPANGWGQKHWECPPDYKSSAYAFILSMPGTPCVYWPDCFDWGHGETIRRLIAARRAAGIEADSSWTDLTDRHTGFAGIVHDANDEQRLALSIQSDFRGPDGWELAAEEAGRWSVWTAP